MRPCDLYNRDPNTDNTLSLYWDTPEKTYYWYTTLKVASAYRRILATLKIDRLRDLNRRRAFRKNKKSKMQAFEQLQNKWS